MSRCVTLQCGLMCPAMVAFALLGLSIHAKPASAQDRRNLRSEGLVLDVGAPTASTSRLMFTRDGRYLLAAGYDKVVRQWPVTPEGKLDREGLKVFRWATYRQQRGTIYDLDLSPDAAQRFVAIGGMGLRNGTLALIDRTTGQIVAASVAPDVKQVVTRLVFSPSGRAIGFGTYDGSVGVWHHADQRVEILGQHAGQQVAIRAVAFLNNDSLISVAQNGSIHKWSLRDSQQRAQTVEPLQTTYVEMAKFNPDLSLLVAVGLQKDNSGSIELRSLRDGTTNRASLEVGAVPLAVDFIPKSEKLTVAVTTDGPNRQLAPIQDFLRVFTSNCKYENTIASDQPSFDLHSLAYAPNGLTFAIAGGDDFELTVRDSASGKITDRVSSPGSTIWQVAFNGDRKLFGFRPQRNRKPENYNERGEGAWQVFRLENRTWATNSEQQEFRPVRPIQETAQWRVTPDTRNPAVWRVTQISSGDSFPLPLDNNQYYRPSCFTFLPGRNGTDDRLVVGHRWGLTVFRLQAGKPPAVARIFVGHQGEVTSVAPSEDQQFLLSASRDQTIACWSLADWSNQGELGVSFVQREGKLEVGEVAVGSPGWDAELQTGDTIESLMYDGESVAGGVKEWANLLSNPIPGRELIFQVRHQGNDESQDTMTTVRQRPLWVFFPTRDSEWAMWRWRDFFYDCSTHGDDYIGWQINGEVDETPTYTRAEQFRRRYYRPDKIAEAIASQKFEPEPAILPELIVPKIQLAAEATQAGTVNATVQVDAIQGPLAAEPVEISLWVNDHKVQRWDQPKLPLTANIELSEADLRAGKNYVIAQGYTRFGVRGDAKAPAIDVKKQEPKPNLFALCVGISDYRHLPAIGARGGPWSDLLYSEEDAVGVLRAFEKQRATGLYGEVRVALLSNSQATRKAIPTYLARVAQLAQSNDLFILFMAGHGWADSRSPTPHDQDKFAFVTSQFDAANVSEIGLPFFQLPGAHSDSLFDMLAHIKVRKLILLDCCHSGGSTDVIRNLMPARLVGPAVIVACGKDEFAWDLLSKGHGAFTNAFLEALEEKFASSDSDRNGLLDLEELALQIKQRVPQLIELARPSLERFGLPATKSQTPQFDLPASQRKRGIFGSVPGG